MPQHELEKVYGLTHHELLDAINRRFRAKVTLEGAVAEVKLGKQLKVLLDSGFITQITEHDEDGLHDYTIVKDNKRVRIECKNVRNSDEAYRKGGDVYAYKVEIQKTRTSQGDPSSRYYDIDQFDVIAVCLGKKTGDWSSFMFCRVSDLDIHSKYSNKLAVMHKVPLPNQPEFWEKWRNSLEQIL